MILHEGGAGDDDYAVVIVTAQNRELNNVVLISVYHKILYSVV